MSQVPDGPKVVVGVDDSPGAATVLGWAAAQARATHAPMKVVFAWRRPDVPGELRSGVEFELDREAERTVSGLVASLAPGVETETVVADAPAVPLLLRQVRAQDLLVLGGHHPVRPGDTPLGGVVPICLAQAPCPVVVVPVPGSTTGSTAGAS